MLRHFHDAEVACRLHNRTFIPAMREALKAPSDFPIRQRAEGARGRELLVMPALSTKFSGVKSLTITPSNALLGTAVIQGVYVLFDGESGTPLATIDAEAITKYRTSAVCAIAAAQLARPNSSELLLIGSGALVPYLAWGYAQVRPLKRIRLWARDGLRAEEAAARVRGKLPEVRVEVARDLEQAVGDADIVSSATRTSVPLLHGAWLRPGTHVDLVGGYRPDMREADDVAVSNARVFVDTLAGCLAEAGDLRTPMEEGIFAETSIQGDLAALIGGAMRQTSQEITLFKTVGMASADLAAASILWAAG